MVRGVAQGPVVGGFNAFGHFDRGDRPQRGHAFDGAEREVVSGDGGGQFAGAARDEPGQFTGILGRAQRRLSVVDLERPAQFGGFHRGAFG